MIDNNLRRLSNLFRRKFLGSGFVTSGLNADLTGPPIFIRIGVFLSHFMTVLAMGFRRSTWNNRAVCFQPSLFKHRHADTALARTCICSYCIPWREFVSAFAVGFSRRCVWLSRVRLAKLHQASVLLGKVANTAPAAWSVFPFVHVKAALNKFMAIPTVLNHISVGDSMILPTKRLDVVRVDAMAMRAFVLLVMKINVAREIANKELVGCAVSEHGSAMLGDEYAVASDCFSSNPKPTASVIVKLKLFSESIQWWFRGPSSWFHSRYKIATSLPVST